ncbi:epoxide hydrolase family protein [Ramlibacter albus]|uniref:Epoxide hydrolase n=1 Tax=Ramlibacter albus TaxID=2079448 RepID=A0A923MEX4_9BURK|nr:epoxide hydrolase family protein [Ramlibacter albus]MBC5768189.1 epoxide hydrolase [Ramlibacter albus]
MAAPQPTPFRVAIEPAVLDDLRARLARTRWPDEPANVPPWQAGTSVEYMKQLVDYWRTGFDWRVHEAALNEFRQFKARVGGIDLHFIHEPGRGPAPMPLLLSHGWPGSVFEFRRLIPMLTDPARFGGDERDAFTVVAPSLPGYGFSYQPGQAAFGVEEIADTFAALMTDVLGYERFAAQGGDWGGFITTRLGHAHAKKLYGIHLNLLAVRRDGEMPQTDEAEKRYAGELAHFLKEETGYQWIQGTRPITLAHGLTDSPAGLAAWIVEKFQRWSDNDGDPAHAVGRDEMLANITLYWVTGAIGSSFWPYYWRMHREWPIPRGATIDVPMGYLEFPKEILRPPRSLAQRTYSDIRRWTVAQRGGHFAAMEQPEVLAHEIREFFRPLRST